MIANMIDPSLRWCSILGLMLFLPGCSICDFFGIWEAEKQPEVRSITWDRLDSSVKQNRAEEETSIWIIVDSNCPRDGVDERLYDLWEICLGNMGYSVANRSHVDEVLECLAVQSGDLYDSGQRIAREARRLGLWERADLIAIFSLEVERSDPHYHERAAPRRIADKDFWNCPRARLKMIQPYNNVIQWQALMTDVTAVRQMKLETFVQEIVSQMFAALNGGGARKSDS